MILFNRGLAIIFVLWYYTYIRYSDDCKAYWSWGKSEHHRVRCQLTTGGGDPKESATENNQQISAIGEIVG